MYSSPDDDRQVYNILCYVPSRKSMITITGPTIIGPTVTMTTMTTRMVTGALTTGNGQNMVDGDEQGKQNMKVTFILLCWDMFDKIPNIQLN